MLVNLKVNLKIDSDHKRLKPSKDLVSKLYWDHGLSSNKIAGFYGFKTGRSITNRMREWNIPIRSNKEAKQVEFDCKPLPPFDVLVDMYKTMSAEEIAKETGCVVNRIKKCLKEHGVKLRTGHESLLLKYNCNGLSPTKDLVNELYWNDGKSVQEIAEICGYKNGASIRSRMKKWGIPIRTKQENYLLKHDNVSLPSSDIIIYLYNTWKLSMNEIGDIYNCSRIPIKNILVNNNVKIRSTSESQKLCLYQREQDSLAKWGYKSPSSHPDIINRRKATYKAKTGYENPFENPVVKDQIKVTNSVKYGGHPMHNSVVLDKYMKTINEKYGTNSHSQKHIKNYDIYSDFNKFCDWVKETSINLGRKVTSTDVKEFFNISFTTAIEKLYELSDIVSLEPYYKLKTSYFELLIEDWLKNNDIVYERNKYYDFLLNSNGNKMQLDFYLPDRKIAIEMNDTWSHNIQYIMKQKNWSWNEAKYYHQHKTDLCAAQGIQLIHIFENKLDQLDIMLNNCKPPVKNLNARDLIYKHDVRVKEFIETYHQQKKAYKSTGGALFTGDGEMVGVITFRKYKTTDMLELEKLCFKTGYNVRGGSSKLFKNYFKHETIPDAGIVTFSNTSYNTGKVYDILGFKPVGDPSPSIYWTNGETWIFRWDRVKSRLKNRFNLSDDYVKNHTSRQILEEQGFVAVCDTYVQKYIFNGDLVGK